MDESNIPNKKTMHTSVNGHDVTLVFKEKRSPGLAESVKDLLLEAWIKKNNEQH